MKTLRIQFLLPTALAIWLCASCATTPNFHPVAAIPPGRGVVYVYSPASGGGRSGVWHNGQKLVNLGPGCYAVEFPLAGTNSYGFQMNYFTRGALIGLMVPQPDPQATVLDVKAGKAYYLKLAGSGMNASLWRVDESAALPELRECHSVRIERAERADLGAR
jgi:hypothetical protein